jgi:hypothetical protein
MTQQEPPVVHGTGVAFDKFGAPYIDVKGDGVSLRQYRPGIPGIVHGRYIETFAKEEFIPGIKEKPDYRSVAIGIDQKLVLVRKLGLKRYGDRPTAKMKCGQVNQ